MPDAFSLWTPARARRFAAAVLISFALALVVTFLSDTARTSSLLRGDFPAFYAAAKLAWAGKGASLYQPSLQAEIENAGWPSLNGSYLAFAYPPYVALLLSPLAFFGPIAAKMIFTLLNFAALNVALYFSARLFPLIARNYFLAFALCISFGPLFSGLIAGQNVAISLMLYVLLLYYCGLNSARADIAGGICLGLLFFKPHFAALFLLAALLARNFRLVASCLFIIGLYYLGGVLVLGPNWLYVWLTAVREFATLDFQANGHQMISLHASALQLATSLSLSDAALRFVNYATFSLSILVLLPPLYFSLLVGKLKENNPVRYRRDLRSLFVILGPCVVLSSVHALYYDLSLCLLAFVLCLRLNSKRQINLLVALWVLIFGMTMVREHFSWQPLVVLVIWAYLRAINLLWPGLRQSENLPA